MHAHMPSGYKQTLARFALVFALEEVLEQVTNELQSNVLERKGRTME